jgi:hypothetical protein
MVLNRASRKEAENRFSALRKQVVIHVFTHRFEDSLCRETRQLAEELAESSSRISVEINDALESGDLLRKFRVDSIPAMVVTGKGSPECRIYGIPLAYAFPVLLDAVALVGAGTEPKPELVEMLQARGEGDPGPGGASAHSVDLLVSRREYSCVEASAAFWRAILAESRCIGSSLLVGSIRIAEDFPRWSIQGDIGAFPLLLVGGKRILSWPFTDAGIAELL